MSKETNPFRAHLVCILERWKPVVDGGICIHPTGFGVKSLGPSLQFWASVDFLQGNYPGALLQAGLAGAQPRFPGPESQGSALEREFLTSLPSGSYTNRRTRATGVYILDQRTRQEWNRILSPSLGSDWTGIIVLPSVPGPHRPFAPLFTVQPSPAQPRISPSEGCPSAILISRACHISSSSLLMR